LNRAGDGKTVLKTASRHLMFGASASGGVSVFKAVLQLALLPVMARLLGPAAFGQYALALPAVTFVSMLSDGGLGLSLAREPDESPVWSTAFWLLLAIGVLLASALAACGMVASHVLGEKPLAPLLGVLSVSLVLIALNVIPSARLSRQGRLGIGAAADLAGNLGGAALGLLCALRGLGAMSLAVQYVSMFVVRAAWMNFSAPCRPSFEFHPALLRGHFALGGLLVASRGVEFGGRVVENTLFSQLLGTSQLGVYAFATQVQRFVNESAGNTVWSAMYIRALHGDPGQHVEVRYRLARLLGVILIPTTLMIAAAAPDLIKLLLGPKWLPAVPLLRVLVPVYALNMISNQGSAQLLAYGRYKLAFYCGTALSLGRIAAILVGPWAGLIGVAWAVAIVNLGCSLAMLFLLAEPTGCRPWRILRSLAAPLAAASAGCAACGAVIATYPASWEALVAALILGFAVLLFAFVMIDGKQIRHDIRSVAQIMREARPA
jgi:PST family polysaccharide transporter